MFEFTQQAKPRWATTGTIVQPQPGDFFMFPALLQHWVCPFKSKVTRISVSGNMRIENRDKFPHDYFLIMFNLYAPAAYIFHNKS